MSTKTKRKIITNKETSTETDVLKRKVISIPELRLSLAEFTKEGISEIGLYEFLIYLSGMTHEDISET